MEFIVGQRRKKRELGVGGGWVVEDGKTRRPQMYVQLCQQMPALMKESQCMKGINLQIYCNLYFPWGSHCFSAPRQVSAPPSSSSSSSSPPSPSRLLRSFLRLLDQED